MTYKILKLSLLLLIASCSTNSTPNDIKPSTQASLAPVGQTPPSDSTPWWQKITSEEKKKLEDEGKSKEDAGIKLADPVNVALEKYFSKENKYPEKLEQLQPSYLEKLVVKESVYEIELTYKPSEDFKNYELSFTYSGFGLCRKSYDNKSKIWTGGCAL
ncbi:MAG: hypothetical protein ACK4IX_17255 [Candidatus Sericytochromatia bacterium]